MRARTASITHEDAYRAGRQTAAELKALLGDDLDLVMMFITSRHAPERVLEGMRSHLPASVRLMGCSSYAEIGAEGAMTGSVAAMGLDLSGAEWELFKLERVEGSSLDAGRALGETILGFDPKLVVVLADAMTINSTKFVRALGETLGDCPVIGGVASDDLEFQRTAEIIDDEVIEGGAVALALRGSVKVVTAARAGFQPVGATRTCTKVEDDKLILELDGESALGLYKDFLGPGVSSRANIGTEFPLAIIQAAGGDYMLSDERTQAIRVVRSLDEERGAVLCGGDVPEGAKVRMTRATKDDLITAAVSAATDARQALPDASFGFLFNCAGRKLVLGARHREEVRAAQEVLGADLPTLGFYTYGEIAPVDGKTTYHDETFTLVLIGTA